MKIRDCCQCVNLRSVGLISRKINSLRLRPRSPATFAMVSATDFFSNLYSRKRYIYYLLRLKGIDGPHWGAVFGGRVMLSAIKAWLAFRAPSHSTTAVTLGQEAEYPCQFL
ncbi:hypothetical protein Poly59_34490 [Rubripirellula reticaptiva]|uniref:Uncharacterized protein n=1 Tax=Rubripirellula reticaptiva TaxID=2528013 RepID=A0A5C6ETZ4_9BACT|nr:hypothetical protein Poly59_34490 [Rubripirellula reticaptiva]